MTKNVGITIAASIVLTLGFMGYTIATSSKPSQQTTTSTTSVTDTTNKTYTVADVTTHKDATSCWSSINGKVYDLTSWIDQHPGGSDKILSICGIDGSSAFNDQHGEERRPENELAGFLIGTLTTQ